MESKLPPLSLGALNILRWLRDNEDAGEDLVCEGRECRYGSHRTNRRTVNMLIRLALISAENLPGEGCERYSVNESGRRYLQGTPPYCSAIGKFHWTLEDILRGKRKKHRASRTRSRQVA